MSGRPTPGAPTPDGLADTRRQLHHAVQILTGFEQALVDPRDDDQHRNFDWDPGARAFRTRPASEQPDLTLALVVPGFELRLERSDVLLETMGLVGTALETARSRMAAATARASDVAGLRFEAPEFDLPDHPVATGAAFDPDPAALHELAAWYTNAFHELRRVADAFGGEVLRPEEADRPAPWVEEVRCWPHHFDIATLLHLREERTIGLGMSPGDSTFEAPYWYLRGYGPEGPLEAPASPPPLPAGGWHRAGWFGAVLKADEVTAGQADADTRRRRTRAFLDAAIPALRGLLE